MCIVRWHVMLCTWIWEHAMYIVQKNKKTINQENYLKLLNGVSNTEIRCVTFVIKNWLHAEIHFVYKHSNVKSSVNVSLFVCFVLFVPLCMYVCMCVYVCTSGLFIWQINISIKFAQIFTGFVVCHIGKKKNFTVVIVYVLNE